MKLRAALLVVGGAVVAFTGCGDDSNSSTATPSSQSAPAVEAGEPEAVFDFAVDSLCDWFSADEMNQIIAAAQERAGTSWRYVEFEDEDCLRREPPVPSPGPAAWDSGRPSNSGLSLMVDMVPVAWTDLEPAEDFMGDEMLDPSITYGDLEHDCGWDESTSFDLRVDGHEEVLLFRLVRPSCGSETQAASLAFSVAEAMLTSMNWIE